MPTTTIFATGTDGYLDSEAATATAAQDGTGTVSVAGAGRLRTGQVYDPGTYPYYNVFYIVSETFLAFDTTGITDPTAVELLLYGFQDFSLTNFIVEARLRDWGSSLTTADWVNRSGLGGLTLLATLDTAAGFSTTAYNSFTESGSAFASNLNLLGETRIIVNSNRHRLGNAPTSTNPNEFVDFNDTETAGTTKDPKIVVTTSGGGSSVARGISANMGVSIPTSGAVTIGAGES